MSGAPLPPIIPEAFGNDADPAFLTIPPDTTASPGRASFSLGFPPLTMQPIAGGGVPPFGQDVNGALNVVTAHDFYTQAGQLWPFNATVAGLMGGYAAGARVISADGGSVWFNTVAGNTTDPDSGGAAGWTSQFCVGGVNISVTAGTVTLPSDQWRHPIIIVSGTLTGNVAVVLPNIALQWLIVNQATVGANTVTVRTAAGTGVVIPAGGPSNPVGVYSDTVNIYPTVPASSLIPASQAATPLTLLERNNLGDAFARFLNTSAPVAAPGTFGGIGAVVVTGGLADGYLRPILLTDLALAIALSSFAGQVTAAQVPLAAVIQYVTNILASAALTGVPTCPTAAVLTSTLQVASTAFVNPGTNPAVTGHRKNPDGTIDQWGSLNIGDVIGPATGTVTFDIPFPVQCFNVEISGYDANGTGATWTVQLNAAPGTNTFVYAVREISTATQNVTLMYRAIGK